MPDDPWLTTPALRCTIRAGRRRAHVARLSGQLEDRDEVATALIDLADLDLSVTRHRLGETDAALPGGVRLSLRALASPRGRSEECGSP
jgi:hypothetical protein